VPRNCHTAKADILQAMPGSVSQLVTKSGYHRATVERWVRTLRAEQASHIIDWLRPNGSGNFIPVHGKGLGEDAPCTLKPLTASDDWKLAKQRYGMDTLRAKERARHWALKARRGRRDPLVAALFGL
jgi:hypothetical protein